MQDAIKHQKKLIFLTLFLNMTGFAVILPLLPSLMNYYLGDEATSGHFLSYFIQTAKAIAAEIKVGDPLFMTTVVFGCLVGSVYAFCSFLFAPIWGRISDRIGRKNVLMITTGGTVVSYLIWAFSKDFDGFLIARVLAGVLAGNISVAFAAMTDITTRKGRMSGMAICGIAVGLGFVLGPLIGGASAGYGVGVISGMNLYALTAFVAAGLSLINFLLIVTSFNNAKVTDEGGISEQPRRLKTNFRGVYLMVVLNFAYMVCFSGLEFTLGFMVRERFAFSALKTGILFFYIGFIIMMTHGVVIRKLLKGVDERKVGFIGVSCGVTAGVLLAIVGTVPMIYVTGIFFGLAMALCAASFSSMISLYAAEHEQGKYMGMIQSAGGLARAIGPLVTAVFYFNTGSKVTYLLISAFLVITLLLLTALPVERRSS